MVSIYRLKPEQTSPRRIDPWHYQPDFERQIFKMKSNLPTAYLSELIDHERGVSGGATPLGANYLKEGRVRFYRTSEVDNMHLDGINAVYISDLDDEKLKRSRLSSGDVLLTITGAKFGKSAVVREDNLPGNISQHSVCFHPEEDKLDPYYLNAFLESKTGQIAIWREAYGATRPAIDFPSIQALLVPNIEVKAQTYIGDKVRQAERLRAWAKQLVADVDRRLNSLQLPINKMPEKSTFSSPSLLSDRLDPRPYRSNVVELVEKIKSIDHERLSLIVNATSGCPVKSSDFIEGEFEVPLVRIRNIGTKDFIGLDTGVNRGVYADSANYQAKEGMIVIGMDGYFRAQYFLPEELPMLINQRVAMLSPTAIRSELLVHWLNRPEGQLQLNQWAVKTTVEHTSLSDISKVLIPRLDEDTEEHFADNLSYARYAERLSKRCTSLAKLLVEGLIEGHISEQELIDAQQALESGNNDLDRALLARFSAKGIDVDGASPLFDDLDQLYSLLEQAELAQQEV